MMIVNYLQDMGIGGIYFIGHIEHIGSIDPKIMLTL